LGSGFFVRGDVVVTNEHVVRGASRGSVKIVGRDARYDILGIVAIDDQRDLALLKVAAVKAAPLRLGDAGTVAVGDEVYGIGNPQGFEGTFSRGLVSGIRRTAYETLFQITAPISPGSKWRASA
jgi:serine protease Do